MRTLSFFILLIIHAPLFAQICAIERTGQNLCDGAQGVYITNTSNSITIHEVGCILVNGLYNLTMNYYRQATNSCQLVINCSAVSVYNNGTNNDVTISFSGCTNLP